MTARVTFDAPGLYNHHGRVVRTTTRLERTFTSTESALAWARDNRHLGPEVAAGGFVCKVERDGSEHWFIEACNVRVDVIV